MPNTPVSIIARRLCVRRVSEAKIMEGSDEIEEQALAVGLQDRQSTHVVAITPEASAHIASRKDCVNSSVRPDFTSAAPFIGSPFHRCNEPGCSFACRATTVRVCTSDNNH